MLQVSGVPFDVELHMQRNNNVWEGNSFRIYLHELQPHCLSRPYIKHNYGACPTPPIYTL